MEEQALFDAADETYQQQQANEALHQQLSDIANKVAHLLNDDEIAVMCWGFGIDKRLMKTAAPGGLIRRNN